MKYQIKQGYRHGSERQWAHPDILELTDEEAAGIMDKVVLVVETDNELDSGALLATIPGMKQEWSDALNELGVTTIAAFKGMAETNPESILAIPGIGPAKLKALVESVS